MSDRTNRESQTREKQARVADWRPPSALEAPDAPVGYKHRWIRESVMEYDDRNNVHKRRREGYELVRAEDYPEFDAPVIDEGKSILRKTKWKLWIVTGCVKATPRCLSLNPNVLPLCPLEDQR